MIEMLAIRAALGKAWGALSSIPWQVWMIGALVVAIPVNGCVQHGRGVDQERAANEAEVERIRAERAALALLVAEQDKLIAEGGIKAIEERRQELDNAVSNIPDQELSPRQRARACAELLRQGRRCELPATTPD